MKFHTSLRDPWECGSSLRHKECVQIGRNDKFKRLLFEFFKYIFAHFAVEHIILKPKEQKLIKAPFIDEISGLAIVKILDVGTHSTLLIKLKFTCNVAVLDIVNNSTETMIFTPDEMLGIVDLRSLGYYKIKQGILQQNLRKYYRFERAEKLCEYFNKLLTHWKRKESKNYQKKIIHGWTLVMNKNIWQIEKY